MSMKPEITVTTQDAERLEILLDSLSSAAFPTKSGLEEELDRAVKPTVAHEFNCSLRIAAVGY